MKNVQYCKYTIIYQTSSANVASQEGNNPDRKIKLLSEF